MRAAVRTAGVLAALGAAAAGAGGSSGEGWLLAEDPRLAAGNEKLGRARRGWADSYVAYHPELDGQWLCHCYTTCDHDICEQPFDTRSSAGVLPIGRVCEDIEAAHGPGAEAGRVFFNDIQCGHGPSNGFVFPGDALPDETWCPGVVAPASEAPRCGAKGPPWDLSGVYEGWENNTEGGAARAFAVLEVATIASGLGFAEGPVWTGPPGAADPALPAETLLFSDIPGDTVHAWRAGEPLATFATPSGAANGHLLDAAGRLVSLRHGGRDVVRGLGGDTGAFRVLAATTCEGRRLNSPNDGALAPSGAAYFTDPPWGLLDRPDQRRELPFHGVFMLALGDPLDINATTTTTNNTCPLRLVLEGLAMPNGVAVADDGATLFVSDTGGRGDHPVAALRESPPAVRAFRLAPDGGLADAAPLWEAGLFSDGMCLDRAGLWTTGPEGLVLLDPADGSERWRAKLPEPPTNVECRTEGAAAADGAGAGARVLFVTAPTRVFRVTYAYAEEEGGR